MASVRRHTYGYLPSRGHLCRATGTELYRLVTEAHVCEQLAQGRYTKPVVRTGVVPETSRAASQRQ